ncbi:MAG: hypothetical protein AW08_03051 [Candidatus Accumulibacter adjunctus]|uniref:Uncharacterized protein n=1 Tax=Candidatus Accumulibacter adjunctus TaxID=1454001 RepID=A0A011NMK6_9PROT|nr:MAG: hypothetical protein AW08_03051 [Candidatus Accumulibacter adjunctus]
MVEASAAAFAVALGADADAAQARPQAGFEGCGQKATYVTVCPLGSPGCVAVSGRNLAQ